jgi:hypothetical protein
LVASLDRKGGCVDVVTTSAVEAGARVTVNDGVADSISVGTGVTVTVALGSGLTVAVFDAVVLSGSVMVAATSFAGVIGVGVGVARIEQAVKHSTTSQSQQSFTT